MNTTIKLKGSGGPGRGQGRKKGFKAIQAEKMREELIDRVGKEFVPIVSAQIEAAKGMYIEKEDKIIYKKEPDLKAGEYLLNQSVGKPKETVEMKGVKKLLIDF